jgi:hypothetical protein
LEQEISPAINNRLSEELITEAVTTTNEVEALIPEEEIFHPQTETIPVDVRWMNHNKLWIRLQNLHWVM